MNDKQKALNQIKQLCDFILDETDTVKFKQTGEECVQMIKCLDALKQTAEISLQRKLLECLTDEDLF